MTTFLVTCGMLHHAAATELLNNIHYLLFDPLEWTHDAQHSWLKKLWTAFVACFKLGMFSLAVLKDIFKLITGPFFLAHCHRSMFLCQWLCFLKNLHLILCTEALQWQWTSDFTVPGCWRLSSTFVSFHSVRPSLKWQKPFKKVSMAHWILFEGHCNHICFCVSFP